MTQDLIHGWVSTNCGRGTIDIIWSCFFTIFFCVWTALHPPIPEYRGNQPRSFRDKIVSSNIVPALISLIAPEFLIVTAVRDFLSALDGVKILQRLPNSEGMSLTHGFFLCNGGFCFKSPANEYHQLSFTEMEHILAQSKSITSASKSEAWFHELTSISEDQINNLAKADSLTKVIACGQALWTVTQIISRLDEHEAVTLLEISTTAYVFCAICAYAAWWKKPQGCSAPIIIPVPNDVFNTFLPSGMHYHNGGLREFVWAGQHWRSNNGHIVNTNEKIEDFLNFGLIALISSIYGAIHIAAWNVTLPTEPELWLWRVCAISCTVIPCLLTVIWVKQSARIAVGIAGYSRVLPIVGLVILYPVIRIYMIVETLISLRALPPSAYDTVQWSSFIPHL